MPECAGKRRATLPHVGCPRRRLGSFIHCLHSHHYASSPPSETTESACSHPLQHGAWALTSLITSQRQNPRCIGSSTSVLFRGNERGADRAAHHRTITPSRTTATLHNKKLVELGKQHQWDALLQFVIQEHRNYFNNVNVATLTSQLARIRSFDKYDPRFLDFLQTLVAHIEARGLPWIEARPAANIDHAIAKMKLKNVSTKRLLEWIANPIVAASFVEEAELQAIANVAWAWATLEFQALHLFAVIDRRSE